MKFIMKLLALFFGVLMLANIANAESPREQLNQMVQQLQKTPGDNALREKIIKLARTMKPALAIPEEAERRMVRGAAAFKGAKSVAADYRDAAKEFEQATLAAPWYGDAYFNLGVAQDKAENYEAALRSLRLAQLASPEVKEIKALIYEVEYRNEKAHSPEAEAARSKADEGKMTVSLDGAIYDCEDGINSVVHMAIWYEVKRGELAMWNKIIWASDSDQIGKVYQNGKSLRLTGNIAIDETNPTWIKTFTVSESNVSIVGKSNGRISFSQICKRR